MIRVDHTALCRGRRTVLEAAGFELPSSALVGLIGANGAGKSTLLLALADLLTTASGALTVTAAEPPLIRIMTQAGGLPQWASSRDAVALYGADIGEVARRYPGLRLAGLADRPIGTLSGGDVQTLNFAIVMDGRADVILLDEPFVHMDIARRRAALDIAATRQNALVILSAQTAADLASCGWYVVIRDGRYVFCGPRDALVADPAHGVGPTAEHLEHRLIQLLGYDTIVAPENDARSFP